MFFSTGHHVGGLYLPCPKGPPPSAASGWRFTIKWYNIPLSSLLLLPSEKDLAVRFSVLVEVNVFK